MTYTVGVTKFIHNQWGEGVLKAINNSLLTIDFYSVGSKILTSETLKNGILTVVTTSEKPKIKVSNAAVKQYDTSANSIDGKNIIEAFCREEIAIFNESYIVIGSELQCSKINATYDLTIIGDVKVAEISVNGDLTVVGNISADKLNCLNSVICQGDMNVQSIYVGKDVIANSIKCDEFVCDGNAIIKTTIDIGKSSTTEKTMVAFEGIIGEGEFGALNAIANEYFEFDGETKGKIIELYTNTTLSEITKPVEIQVETKKELSFVESLAETEELLNTEMDKLNLLEENDVIDLLRNISKSKISKLVDSEKLFTSLVNLSYQDEISDFGDYLIALYAQTFLPEQIYKYETLEHIFSMFMPKAIENLHEMKFLPESVEKIALSLKLIEVCSENLDISINQAYDKVFSSIGLKYITVKNAIENHGEYSILHNEENTNNNSSQPIKSYKLNMTKEEFLSLSLYPNATKYGLTKDEIQTLLSINVKTFKDILSVSEERLRNIFKKKQFLANHILRAIQKISDTLDTLD